MWGHGARGMFLMTCCSSVGWQLQRGWAGSTCSCLLQSLYVLSSLKREGKTSQRKVQWITPNAKAGRDLSVTSAATTKQNINNILQATIFFAYKLSSMRWGFFVLLCFFPVWPIIHPWQALSDCPTEAGHCLHLLPLLSQSQPESCSPARQSYCTCSDGEMCGPAWKHLSNICVQLTEESRTSHPSVGNWRLKDKDYAPPIICRFELQPAL